MSADVRRYSQRSTDDRSQAGCAGTQRESAEFEVGSYLGPQRIAQALGVLRTPGETAPEKQPARRPGDLVGAHPATGQGPHVALVAQYAPGRRPRCQASQPNSSAAPQATPVSEQCPGASRQIAAPIVQRYWPTRPRPGTQQGPSIGWDAHCSIHVLARSAPGNGAARTARPASATAGGQRQIARRAPHLQDVVQALGRDQADGAEGGQADAMLGDPAQRSRIGADQEDRPGQVGATSADWGCVAARQVSGSGTTWTCC